MCQVALATWLIKYLLCTVAASTHYTKDKKRIYEGFHYINEMMIFCKITIQNSTIYNSESVKLTRWKIHLGYNDDAVSHT